MMASRVKPPVRYCSMAPLRRVWSGITLLLPPAWQAAQLPVAASIQEGGAGTGERKRAVMTNVGCEQCDHAFCFVVNQAAAGIN